MRRDGLRRFCEKCDKHVHDLAAMTEREARAFVRSVEGREVCVRYRVDADGELRFASPPPLVGAGMLVAAAGLLAACAGWETPDTMTLADAELCRDQAGYVIACEDAEPTIPDELAPLEEPVEETSEGEVEGGVEGEVEGVVVGAMVVETPGQASCPLPPPPVQPQRVPRGDSILQGVIVPPVETGRSSPNPNSMEAYLKRLRQKRRAERRERRRERRQR